MVEEHQSLEGLVSMEVPVQEGGDAGHLPQLLKITSIQLRFSWIHIEVNVAIPHR